MNARVGSRSESSPLAGSGEQGYTHAIPYDELIPLQRSVEEVRISGCLVCDPSMNWEDLLGGMTGTVEEVPDGHASHVLIDNAAVLTA